jgi:hypothetical protein
MIFRWSVLAQVGNIHDSSVIGHGAVVGAARIGVHH